MNVHLSPVPEQDNLLRARFDLRLQLPAAEWLTLFELAEKAGQTPPAYVVAQLQKHLQEALSQNRETR
ncbi:MAG: hypothetical protein HUU38_24915 [Anaerolineales bacterium]|nr:hypothetical protein [Anaerolineales bacterium]